MGAVVQNSVTYWGGGKVYLLPVERSVFSDLVVGGKKGKQVWKLGSLTCYTSLRHLQFLYQMHDML